MASTYFNGNRYTRSGKYYYKTRWKSRTALHRDIWEFHNGPIPPGFHVHHIDHDRENNGFPSVMVSPRHLRIDKRRLSLWFNTGGLGVKE